jgi:hypothetical protein
MAKSILTAGVSSVAQEAACVSCGSVNQSKFDTEIAVHFNSSRNPNRPHVFLFPNICFCMNCGRAEFAIPESELRVLANDNGLESNASAT